MKFTAQQIASLLQGEIIGNEHATVSTVSKIEESLEGDLCFLANAKYEQYLYTTKATIVLINKSLTPKQSVEATLIQVEDAYASFAKLLRIYEETTQSKPKAMIEQPSFIHETANLGTAIYVGAFAYIGEQAVIGDKSQIHAQAYIGDGVKIGKNTCIHAGAKIYRNCEIGDNVIIHAGTIIGSDGFGFAFENGAFQKIPQVGNVIIENNVEIGANCTIDRATMGSTIIRQGAKLDNLIQIAHNVEVGANTVIAAQAGISGSTKIGKYCQIGGQAGIVGHIKIADGTKINAQSGVAKEVKESGVSLTGSPAFDYKSTIKSQIIFRNLPEMQTRITQLEHELKTLKETQINQ
jgi:UDP-3-O-[3-hydroxymyristoyl] glucosamine N-acyltransferase